MSAFEVICVLQNFYYRIDEQKDGNASRINENFDNLSEGGVNLCHCFIPNVELLNG